MTLLTFGIPTYNRGTKVRRLLEQLEMELADNSLSAEVEVLVSDNCSADDTPKLAGEYAPRNYKLRYVRQPRNLGFDGNIDFLYNNAASDYVWFFSDDDVLLPGTLRRMVDTLKASRPSALLFSFQQPPDSTFRRFEGPEPFYEVTDPKRIIEHLGRCVKISIYVLERVAFSASQLEELAKFRSNGFYFVDLSFSVVSASKSHKVCVIPELLAACDREFLVDVFDPWVIKDGWALYQHSYVLANAPEEIERQKHEHFRAYMDFLFDFKVGRLTARNPKAYEDGIAKLEFRPSTLLRFPKTLIKYVLLKSHLASLFRR